MHIKDIQAQENQINIKDIIRVFQSWFSFFKANIVLVISFGFLFAIMSFIFALNIMPEYKAELRFVVKSEGAGSGVSGVLGGLGAVLGGNTMGSSLERTIEIASSDRIVGSALLAEVNLSGKKEILANSLIRLNNLHLDWEDDTLLRGIKFSGLDTSIEKMSFAKRKAIKKLENILIPKSGKGVISKSFDKKSGVVTLSSTHQNEEFAIVITKEIYHKLRDFYVEQMVTSASNNVLVLQKKLDSIKFELSKVQSLLARASDQSYGLLFQEDKIELRKLAVREQMLLAMYSEAQKNFETFKFMNDSAIPTLTVIDMPYSPLMKIESNKILFTLSGFFLGSFLTFIIISIRDWYKKLILS